MWTDVSFHNKKLQWWIDSVKASCRVFLFAILLWQMNNLQKFLIGLVIEALETK